MYRLTQKDEQGNWCLKGQPWAQLHVGQTITPEAWEKLYGALWKLMESEDTGLTPDEVEGMKRFEGSNTEKYLAEKARHRWLPVEERIPEEREVVLACDNNGGITLAWYQCGRWFRLTSFTGDRNYIVDAWMPLPKPYIPETLREAGAEAGVVGLMPAT